ncbi:MAG: hypothetical protein FJX28_06495 [Alphaproteobacteria bacterium]|nr:hypothetical protein [Alphaproteobacteria bacterium]
MIAHEGGKQGVFVHVSALNRADLRGLKQDWAVILDIRAGRDSRNKRSGWRWPEGRSADSLMRGTKVVPLALAVLAGAGHQQPFLHCMFEPHPQRNRA